MKSLIKKLVGVSLFSFVLVLFLAPAVFAAPDLGMTQLQASPVTVNPGETVDVTIEVTNVGTNTSSGANVSAVVSYSGSTVLIEDFNGYALDPGESQSFSFSWTPYNTGDYDIEVTVSAPNDSNSANDVATTTITSTTSSGAVLISDFYATETLFADNTGCLMQPLVVSGFVREDGEGTDDRVYIYMDGQLLTFDETNPSNDGYFRVSLPDLCFEDDGTYTVRADVDRGSGAIATASQDVELNFNPLGNGSGGSVADGFYAVDLEATPYTLNVRTGENDKYLLRMKNLGDEEDEYFIEIEALDSQVDRWVSLSGSHVVLEPGEVSYAHMIVELPEDAMLGKYPIQIRINGVAQDVDRVYLNVLQGENYQEGGSGNNYEVDLQATPYDLNIEAGETGTYTLKIKNIGNLADEYELRASTSSVIDSWIEFEDELVTVNPGRTEYVDLFIHVPKGVDPQGHSLTLRADGTDTDSDKIKFNVLSPAKTFDVDVKKPRLNPEQTWTDKPKTVEVSAPVSFRDLRTAEGQYVTVKLYVNGIAMNAKTPFISSDSTETVTFYFDTEEYPIENREGDYEVYMTAQADYEKDRSAVSPFSVLEPGVVEINVTADTEEGESVEVPINGTFEFSLEITNKDHSDNTYSIIGSGLGSLELDPNSVKVDSGKTETVKVKGTIADEPEGEHPITVTVEDKNDASDSAEKEMNLLVTESLADMGSELDTDGVSGYLLFSNTGRGMLVGLLIFAVIGLVYYRNYYQKTEGDEDGEEKPNFLQRILNKEKPESEGEEGKHKKKESKEKEKVAPKEKEGKNEEEMKKEVKEEIKTKEVPTQSARTIEEKPEPEEELTVWEGKEGINLGEVNILNEPVSKEGNWSPKDSESVLLNLEDIKKDFHQDVNHVNQLKRNMGQIVDSTGRPKPKPETSGKSFKKKTGKPKGKKGKKSKSVQDEYIESIVKKL